jgi:hypothetical protein
MDEDPRRARLRAICAGLPEAASEVSGRHETHRVRGRTFAYFLDDHQGDGIVGLACKAPEGKAEALWTAEPDRFYRPAYLWHRGWLGVRLDAPAVDWEDVADLVTDSYVLVAPKRLGAQVGEPRR